MDELKSLIDRVEERVVSLMEKCDRMQDQNATLLHQTHDLNQLVEKQRQEMEALTHENKMLRMAESLAGTGGGNSETRSKINSLVREIDKCITLLNR